MYDTLCSLVSKTAGLPERAWRLECLRRVRDGEIYDNLTYQFHQERGGLGGQGEYIPIAQRKPSVRCGLARVVVDDSVGFLFGEGRFPALECEDSVTRDSLREIVKDSRFAQVMTEAALRGSIGSVAVLMRVLKNRVFWSVMESIYLTPTFDPEEPDTLKTLNERYQIQGRDLTAIGYDIPDDKAGTWFWFEREWDAAAETWFLPIEVGAQDQARKVDAARTVEHKLGFVPAVWIRNLPGGNDPDGECTFRVAIETIIEIDYQLSQAGRGLRYSSDPTLLIKEPAAAGDELERSASNALVVSKDGDAKLLEINGTAASAVIEYVEKLREAALESVHGNRSSPERTNSAASGRALEIQHLALIGLADKLRANYGEDGILTLLAMVRRAASMFSLRLKDGRAVGPIGDKPLSLRWPEWFPPGEEEKQIQGSTIAALYNAGLLSRETAIAVEAANYDIEDVTAEIALIKKGEAEADARAAAQAAAQVQIKETAPG